MKGRYERQFIRELGNIKDAAVFMGVVRILKVNPMKDKDTVKEFNEVLEEVLNAYIAADLKRKKELLKILKDANKCKENFSDGYNTKVAAETSSDEKM